MTERGLPSADASPACPFVAFEDDRDGRADRPDHRHRCFAEGEPAPRALAHQEAYCLSSAFPVCPVFQTWARREAAQARSADAAAAAAGATAAASADAAAPAAAAPPADAAPTGPSERAASLRAHSWNTGQTGNALDRQYASWWARARGAGGESAKQRWR